LQLNQARKIMTLDLDDLKLESYNYQLPPERIAQNPAVPRDSSRLLVVDSPTTHRHCIFRDLPDFLQPGDLLVLNNTRVIPARLKGHKSNGSRAEVLLMEERGHNCWLALVKPGKRLKPGARIDFDPLDADAIPPGQGLSATVLEREEGTGGRYLQFDLPDGKSLIPLLAIYGHIPLPPYIKNSQALSEQYQTIYAQKQGAIAAPTAGLHFTDELLQRLQAKGIERAFVTLHVGVGTFRPVEVEDITTHRMHQEWIELPGETATKIRQTQEKGGRILAVGTTAVRSLEGAAAWAQQNNLPQIEAFCGHTDLFIYPGYQWQVVEGLITNFHLPYSSLLMLVSAMIGRQRLFNLYEEAIAQEYRFYSFGDAMLILPGEKN
jgi:S-adenosylmethionine:tRNA ribosyltransferase-isomerase